ncbi:MAG: hypothetical protein KJ804_09840 [Proteobacteria bacterium]|nr:hypothetical protein [Pseudomonadota bacterium]MBU1058603.1 hypothetical protein [Pseudomonadota bacterium]
MVCAAPLQYQTQAIATCCTYCQSRGTWYISCANGHVVCDSCHNQETLAQVEAILFQAVSSSPLEISEQCMDLPILPMLGCQHAFIAGGALIAALKNSGAFNLTNHDIREVLNRTEKQAHGGYCGLTGVCGVVPALGACVAVITGSKCGLDREQRLTMELVSRVVRAITELSGPSCCKAYVRISLEVAINFLQATFALPLPNPDTAICQHMTKHPHGCRKTNCPYYPQSQTTRRKEVQP